MTKARFRLRRAASFGERASGNGILSRRIFLEGALVTGAARAGVSSASAEPLTVESWMKEPGSGFTGYGQPSRFEDKVERAIPPPPIRRYRVSAQRARRCTCLKGIITPMACISSAAIPASPTSIPTGTGSSSTGWCGARSCSRSRRCIATQCSHASHSSSAAGNSGALNAPQAQPLGMAVTHGLLGCSEWTGVKLSTLLDEAGLDPSARWVIAEGADAAAMSRSIPLAKAMDDALLCLYQNGERVRPSNGYPVRLLSPASRGNMNVKWLRRLKVTAGPAMTKDETSKYTILLKDEKAWQFVFPMEVKSVITRPRRGSH